MTSNDARQLLLLRSIEELSELPLEAANASEFFETLTQIIMGALGVSRGCIYYCDNGSQNMSLLYTKGLNAPQYLQVPDEIISVKLQNSLKKDGIFFLIPLKLGKKQIGLIGLGKKLTEANFSPKDRQLISPISSLMGLLLANFMSLYRSMEESKKLRAENLALVELMPSRLLESFPYLSASDQMKHVFQSAQSLASRREPILIVGSKGSGHRLITHLIHSISSSPIQSIRYLNCASDTQDISKLKNMLNEKTKEKSLINTSILVENIAALPRQTQQKLRNFLVAQRKKPSKGYLESSLIFSINGTRSSLNSGESLISDLVDFFKETTIVLPTLQELQKDLPIMIDFAVSFFAQRHKKEHLSISLQAKEYLEKRQWKANLAELEYLIEQAVISIPGMESVLEPHHFQSVELKSEVKYIPLPINVQALDEVRKAMIQNAMLLNDGKKVAAAELLGVTRQTLDNLITRLDLVFSKD